MIQVKINEQFYNVEFHRMSENTILLIGDIPVSTNGFVTYRLNGKQLGDFSDYTTIYRQHENGIEFSNDGSIYVEPMPYVPTLEELKTAKLAEVDTWTASKITGGFVSGGVRYDSDIEAQTTVQGIALSVNTERFATDYPHGYPESGYDEGATEKTVHYLTAEEVLMLCSDLSNHINKCRRDGWTMKQAVLEATSKEELDNIQLD